MPHTHLKKHLFISKVCLEHLVCEPGGEEKQLLFVSLPSSISSALPPFSLSGHSGLASLVCSFPGSSETHLLDQGTLNFWSSLFFLSFLCPFPRPGSKQERLV